jgi:hypothetical protein
MPWTGRAAFREPFGDLVVRDQRRTGLFGQVRSVRQVIEVAVRNQNVIRLDPAYLHAGRVRIRTNERIEQQALACDFDDETGVTVIGDFHGNPFAEFTMRG